jgi:regulator of sirC expression with transglutaminase-like and TPR domain
VTELAALLAGRPTSLQLDEAALLLARIEHPELDAAACLSILDSYAVELGGRLRDPSGETFVAEANRFLFDELGFTGNTDDYYNPANSCLNEVLASKTGIPITLSVVYLEIARRLAKPVFGIGQPGHFVVQYDDGVYSTYIDPFHRGRLLETAEPARVDNRQIVARMVNNLRRIYFARQAHRKTAQLLTLLLEADPGAAEEYKQRGVAFLQIEQLRAAKADFERYVELAPDAPDREAVENQLVSLKRWLIGMN